MSGNQKRIDAFNSRWELTANGCWEWQAQRSSGPYKYGVFSFTENGEKRVTIASRASWELHHGPIPDGMMVCHHCDNPPCVNPAHLFLGTQTDNMRDMIAKGRKSRHMVGAGNVKAKLQAADVSVIREMRLQGTSAALIAEKFGITLGSVYHIEKRRTWKSVN